MRARKEINVRTLLELITRERDGIMMQNNDIRCGCKRKQGSTCLDVREGREGH